MQAARHEAGRVDDGFFGLSVFASPVPQISRDHRRFLSMRTSRTASIALHRIANTAQPRKDHVCRPWRFFCPQSIHATLGKARGVHARRLGAAGEDGS